jgi:hypothetical protein
LVDEKEIITLSHSEIFLREDGIVEILIKESSSISDVECKEMLASYKTILNNKKYPMLHIVENYVSFEKSAREFSASPEGMAFSEVEAYVINSLAHKLLANFYLKVNRPPVPTKFFSTKKEAITWLQKYL